MVGQARRRQRRDGLPDRRVQLVGMGVGVGTGGGAKLAYKTQAEIVMKSGTKPEGDATAFDARQIQLNLQAQVLPSGTAKPE